MYLYLFLSLYVFRAQRAHHQERKIMSIQPLVAVTLCVGGRAHEHGHRQSVTATRGGIDIIFLSWWWARCARNM